MFIGARIKLTFWYLLIIMLISISFSAFIYQGTDRELERIERRQEIWSRRLDEIPFPEFPERSRPFFEPIPTNEIRQRIIFSLTAVNSIILALSGAAGYFLAGRTLKPIAEMVDEQNRFVSDASHEIRTPLTALKSSMEVSLRDKKLSIGDAKSLIKESLIEVERLKMLSDSLLQLTSSGNKIRDGKYFEDTDISATVRAAINKVSGTAEAKKIKIIHKQKKLMVSGIKESLTDLFVILLDNAVKYSCQGKKINVAERASDQNIEVSVTDEGIGISQDDLPKIFDRFFRADKARTSEGYGLGLSIAQKITEMHKGRIIVESVLKKGSNFKVILPVTKNSV